MKKKIIGISLCYAYILNAGWYDDAKLKAHKAYNSSQKYVSATYKDAKGKYENYTEEQKKAYNKKITKCANDLKKVLPKYGLLLEQNYMDINRMNETKTLRAYQQLKTKGISSKLQTYLPKTSINRLSNASSTLEYMNIILSELKRVQKKLKKNNPASILTLMKQTEFLMYSWTTPFELFSTKKIYDNSLLNNSNNLYTHLDKTDYTNYTEFIYSMIDFNLLNGIIIAKKNSNIVGKSTTISPLALIALGNSPTSEDKKGLKAVCQKNIDEDDIEHIPKNISSTLDIKEEKIEKELNKISKRNNIFEAAMIFNKEHIKLHEVSIINNPLNDSWYLMIREYMELQNDFYKIKEEVNRIKKILTILPNNEKQVATLTQNLFDVDALYRKFDEIVRYNIIDLPVSIYADLYFMKFRKAKKWYNDDEKAMGNIAIAYNKSCANMQKYMVSEFAVNRVMRVTRTMKKEFNEDEWKEIKTRAKLTQDWFNMLNKVSIKNK